MLVRTAGLVTMLPLLAAQNCEPVPYSEPTREETCLSGFATWAVLGLAPEQVPENPNQLLKARLAVGDRVALRATTLGQPGRCDDLAASITWRSSEDRVAAVSPDSAATASLTARSPGEAVVWADVTLQDGTLRRAELFAMPAGRTAVLRVYGVAVIR